MEQELKKIGDMNPTELGETLDRLMRDNGSGFATVDSPQKLRRLLRDQELGEIRELVREHRYEAGKDSAWFFTLAQTANVEAKKLYKQGK